MGYAEKRARGWRARYLRPDGSYGSEPGFGTKRAAEAYAADQEALIRAGRWIDPSQARMPLREWAAIWFEAMTVEEVTEANREYRLSRWILPEWGETPICEITWFMAKAWRTRLVRGRECAPSTADGALSLLSTILTAAVDDGRLLANPLWRRRASSPSDQLYASGGRERVWVQPEVAMAIADRLEGPRRIAVLLAAWAGMRWGEITGLHRDNAGLLRYDLVDGRRVPRRVIKVMPDIGALHEVRGRLYLGAPKPPSGAREIDIPPSLAGELDAFLATWELPYVCCSPRRSNTPKDRPVAWWKRGNFADILRAAVNGRPSRPALSNRPAAAAWEPLAPGLTMHGLRHSYKTWCREDRLDDVLVRAQMGHARSREIGEHYTHPTPAMRRQLLEALEARWRYSLAA